MPVSVGELLAYLRLDSSGFDRGIGVAQREMRTTAGAADRMSEAVGVTSERLAGAGREAQVAATGSAKYRAAQLSLVSAQERYNTVLNQGNASAGKLAAAEAAVVRANDRVATTGRAAATAVARQAGAFTEANTAAAATPGLMTRSASGILSAGRAAIGLGAAFGAFELAKKAIDITKEASQFQRSMLLIQTNAGKSAAEVKLMTDAVLQMSPEVAAKPNDLANALYHVEQNGITGKRALDALRAGAEGAKIGLADVEDTTNTMTIAVASGIHGMGDLQKAMGTMIAIAGTGDMRLKDLNEALSGGILAIAKGYGASLQDVAAVLATLGDNGIRGADAATQLRMVLMSLSNPAAKGKQALADIGLSMTSLRDDMEKNGLVHAMNDLQQHMAAAGVTGAKVGGFLTEAFGKKAGAGMGVLVGEIGRVNTKFEEGKRGAASFAQKWEDTTHTASFAFQKLGAEFEAAGIKLADKLIPAITSAATWLGTNLPHAASTMAQILGPMWDTISAVAVPAFKALGVVLKVAAEALGTIGGVLAHHNTLYASIGLAVVGMWAAYKGFTIARDALRAIDLAIGRLAARMSAAGGAMAGMRGGMTQLSTSAVVGGAALAGLGVVIAGLTMLHEQHAQQVAVEQAAIEAYTQAVQQDNGVIGANTRAVAENSLAKLGAYQAGLKLGISQKTMTDAALGDAKALQAVRDALKGAPNDADKFKVMLGSFNQSGLVKKGIQNAKDMAAANKGVGKSAKDAGTAAATGATGVTKLQTSEQKAAEAAQRLDDALKALSGTLNSRQALDQFRSTLAQVKGQLDKHTNSLRGNSVAAVNNRLAIDSAVQGVLSYVQALKDQGKTQPQISAALQSQIGYLLAHARQMGVNKDQLRSYIGELNLLPKQIISKLGLSGVEQAKQQARDLRDYISGLRAAIYVSTVTGTKQSDPRLNGRATGGGLPEGVSAVGEAGPELAVKHGPHVAILSNSQSKGFLAATGMKAPGFASGTLNPHGFLTSLGKDSQSEGYAFSQLLAIGTKAGLSSQFTKHLTAENDHLRSAITERNRLAAKLAADNQKLIDAQKLLTAEKTTVHDAIVGSFDVTTAGTGFDGQQPITGKNMLAQEMQAANRARAFVAAVKKLRGRVGAAYLYQIAEKGPDALPEAQALLSLNKSDLAAFNGAAGSLNTSGNQLGTFIGNTRFGGAVTQDKRAVAADKRAEAHENKYIDKLGAKIVKELVKGIEHLPAPHLTVYLDGKKIATAVAVGKKKNGARN